MKTPGAGRRAALVGLLALLVGPLAATEIWARGQLELLYPYIQSPSLWPDTKLLLLERAGCPELLALGSSVTNRSFAAPLSAGHALPFPDGERALRRPFAFGLNAAPMALAYAAWRGVHTRGCTPPFVFVEVLPGTLRSRFHNPVLLRPLADAATQLRMPEAFFREMEIDARTRLRWATWDRLLVHRLRGPLRRALADRAMGRAPRKLDLALDGATVAPFAKTLEGERFAEERATRERFDREGRFEYRVSTAQVEALERLTREVAAAGARVVLHTPPVTSIYRDIAGRRSSEAQFCALRRRIAREGELEWQWAYAAHGYERAHFADWVHLNRAGGKRYVARLLDAVREGRRLDDDWCDGR